MHGQHRLRAKPMVAAFLLSIAEKINLDEKKGGCIATRTADLED
jgi:hypothetical protein